MNIQPALRTWLSAGQYAARELRPDLLAFRFGDEADILPASVGGVAVLRLLEQAPHDVSAWELESDPAARVLSRTVVLETPQARAKVETEVRRLATEAVETDDPIQQAGLEQKRRGFLKYLRGNTKIPGSGRRSAGAVSMGLVRFYCDVGLRMPAFVQHLAGSIVRRNACFCYIGAIKWRVTRRVTPNHATREPIGVEAGGVPAGVHDESSGQTVD